MMLLRGSNRSMRVSLCKGDLFDLVVSKKNEMNVIFYAHITFVGIGYLWVYISSLN